ncbi:MAG TPA: hypothetical protein VEC58_00690 [Roseiarcus sp.]|nr:hypothetical protein [Roseiarcus sp.]
MSRAPEWPLIPKAGGRGLKKGDEQLSYGKRDVGALGIPAFVLGAARGENLERWP